MDNRVYKLLEDNNIAYTMVDDETIRIDDRDPRNVGIFVHGLNGVFLAIADKKSKRHDENCPAKGSYTEARCLYLFGDTSDGKYKEYIREERKQYGKVFLCACLGPLQDFIGTIYKKGELGWTED